MTTNANEMPPWSTGPAEILRHALDLLRKDSDTNRRLAMISIDNAVELTMKTYLGLPSRVTKLRVTRAEQQEFAESYPKLLDAVEKHASGKIQGINLGEVEFYHRIRNALYHQGNGLTVERQKVVAYAEIANLLFENLFGTKLIQAGDPSSELFGQFMTQWIDFEREVLPRGQVYKPALVPVSMRQEIAHLRDIRNRLVHGIEKPENLISDATVRRLQEIVEYFRKKK